MDTSSSDIAGARRVSISAASARESRSWANCTSPTLPRAPRPEWGYRPARQLTPTATHLPPSLLRRTRRRGEHRRISESGSEHRRPLLRTVRDQMCHRPHGVVMRRAFYRCWGDVLPPRWTSSSSQERSSNGQRGTEGASETKVRTHIATRRRPVEDRSVRADRNHRSGDESIVAVRQGLGQSEEHTVSPTEVVRPHPGSHRRE